MNPRQKIADSQQGPTDAPEQRRTQFLRRGFVYGPRKKLKLRPTPEEAAEKDVGLLFMGYMSSVKGQFRRMHNNWATDPGFPITPTRIPDTIFANQKIWNELERDWGIPRNTWTWEPASGVKLEIPVLTQFITPKGGAHFLVPPVSWLSAQ